MRQPANGCPLWVTRRRSLSEPKPYTQTAGPCGVAAGAAHTPTWDHGTLRPRGGESPETDMRVTYQPCQPCPPVPGPHRPGRDQELLHHRPHRSRQVDLGRPDAAVHRRGGGAPDARAVPGPDGHRARARHHDQEPGGKAALDQRRRPEAVRAQPHRHSRSRGLHLRGLPQPGRLRGSGPAGRRRPGHRGADPGQPVPGPGRRPQDHPGAEQDRPARRAARPLRRRTRRASSASTPARSCGCPPRPARASSTCCTRSSGSSRPRGRPGRPGPRAHLRLDLRHLPRRGHLRPGRRRPPHEARAVPDDVHRRGARDPRGGGHLAGAHAVGEPGRRRGRLPDHRGQGRPPGPGRRHRDQLSPPREGAAGGIRPSQADGLLRPVPGGRRRLPGPARRAGQAAAERRGAGIRAGDQRRPRLRLPLRVPRPAAHGDRARAAGAGVRPVAHLHRPERRLPRRHGHRPGAAGDQPQRLPGRTPSRKKAR